MQSMPSRSDPRLEAELERLIGREQMLRPTNARSRRIISQVTAKWLKTAESEARELAAAEDLTPV